MMSTTSQTAMSRQSMDRAIWSDIIGVLRSGPELAVEALLGLVDRALVGARGEVLPAAVEVAQPVDELAVARLGGHDLHVGLLLAEEPARPHQGAGGAEPGHEVGD